VGFVIIPFGLRRTLKEGHASVLRLERARESSMVLSDDQQPRFKVAYCLFVLRDLFEQLCVCVCMSVYVSECVSYKLFLLPMKRLTHLIVVREP
jgi:hypothetical protein